MKKSAIIFLPLLVFFLFQGRISKFEAKEIITQELIKNPRISKSLIVKNNHRLYNDPNRNIDRNNISQYLILAEKGFLKLDTSLMHQEIYDFPKYTEYNISYTKKSKSYVTDQDENYFNVKTSNLRLEEIVDINHIPYQKTAEVKVKLKRVGQTPFLFLDKIPSFETRVILFEKTEQGWSCVDDEGRFKSKIILNPKRILTN